MTILVAVSSKHGSTREIADVIAEVLVAEGFDVTVADPDKVPNLDRFRAVVIGSALYFGQWQPGAIGFVRRFTDRLNTLPVWAFSSGYVGFQLGDQPANVDQYVTLSHAMEHRLFGGYLNESRLDTVEKLLVKSIDAPNGDARDWNEIRAWAKEIAASLQETHPVGI